MLLKFVEVVDAMAYAAAGLCLFAVVWAGFLLIAEGSEERELGQGKERRGPGGHGPGPHPLGKGHCPSPAPKVIRNNSIAVQEKDNHLNTCI